MWFTRSASCTNKRPAGSVGRVDPATGTVQEFRLITGSSPYAIASFNGQLWVSDQTVYDSYFRPHRLMWVVNTNGSISFFKPNQDVCPVSMTVGPDGNLWYVGSTRNGKPGLGYMTSAQQVTYNEIKALAPTSIVAGSDKKIYFTNPAQGTVYQVTVPYFRKPHAISVGGRPAYLVAVDKSIVYSDQSVGQLSIMDANGKVVVYPAPSGERPGFLARKADGTVLFVDAAAGNASVGSFDPATGIYGAEVSPPNPGLQFMANGSDGNMWFDDTAGYVGAYLKFILTTAPSSLTFDGTGQTQTFTVSESNYTGSFTATSEDANVASVTEVNQTTFSVESTGQGSTQILVADQQRNAVDVAIEVGGAARR
jgi:streptogramin lyase